MAFSEQVVAISPEFAAASCTSSISRYQRPDRAISASMLQPSALRAMTCRFFSLAFGWRRLMALMFGCRQRPLMMQKNRPRQCFSLRSIKRCLFLPRTTATNNMPDLRGQRWGSEHHRWFQIGVAETGSAEKARATEALKTAISYYIADGRAWCALCIERAEALISAIESDRHNELLEQWCNKNSRIHRLH